ncbi:hypothetical protein BCR36DRAFT_412909 [Piromyces finnis]|uniref:RRM domain-containing protein n=1 Tax=Piromyces finnis TaxID=1754191 RepID=A0A1Y1V7A0_9FUNG|nr:hypothetical protein BCR36DRAFT_412909 [Piromyces finnis]|eukprot:ORX48900.1 hypothetical protein BCR36DRAFT_412909 [Piromyces finnis]
MPTSNQIMDGNNQLNSNFDEMLMKDNAGYSKTNVNKLWKNPELIPNYQPHSQQNLMPNKNDIYMNDYRANNVLDAMNKMSLSNIQKPVNSPNFMYHKFPPPPMNNKKGSKNNTMNHWDNTIISKTDENNKKKEKSDTTSFSNNEYDTSIVINNLSKDVSEKMIQLFYKDFKIKNLKINRNSENIIAYIDFENAEMCTEAKKKNTLPLKDNRKKFMIGRLKPSSDDDLKKRENLILNINSKNHNNNFMVGNHNNDLLMKQQVLRKTKSNNNIYTGWKTTSTNQEKNLEFNEKVFWPHQSVSNVILDQNNHINTINLNSSNITNMWMNNSNKLKDTSSSFNNMTMNDNNISNNTSFNNIPINNFEGYPYMPPNNNNIPLKQQHPFYMNPLNHKMNTSSWDAPPNGTIDQNSGMMPSINSGINNSSNKLMLNQGQGPLYMNQMQQPNPIMSMNQNNGMMLPSQNPFPSIVPPNRKQPINGNQIMMNNYSTPAQPPPQNININNESISNNPSLLNNGSADISNTLMNDSSGPTNEWNNSNNNINSFIPLYYQDDGMNGSSNRPMKLMYNSINQYPIPSTKANSNPPNISNPTLNPGSSMNTNQPSNNNNSNTNPINNVNSTNNPSDGHLSNPNNGSDSGNIWDPPPFNNQNYFPMNNNNNNNNNSWNVFNNSNNILSGGGGMTLNTPMNDSSTNDLYISLLSAVIIIYLLRMVIKVINIFSIIFKNNYLIQFFNTFKDIP